jgi:hypothetical protein
MYLAWTGGVVLLGIGALVIFVFPTRKWVDQHNAISSRQQQLAQLQTENQELASRIGGLQTNAEIERIARSQYGFVRPGQQSFVVLTPPAPELPDTWPYALVKQVLTAK